MAVLGASILNVMRLNAARLYYVSSTCFVTIGGAAQRARLDNFSIRETINSTPNTATVRVSAPAPAVGADFVLMMGTTAPQSVIYRGTIQKVTQVVELAAQNVAYDLDVIDYQWLLDKYLVTWSPGPASASYYVTTLMTWASGYTTNNVQPNLPTIQGMTWVGQALSKCLTDVANMIGAVWKITYTKDLIFATDGRGLVPPDAIGVSSVQADTDYKAITDLSQVRTRVLVKGAGATLTADAAVGATTLVVSDVTPFVPSGSVVSAQPVEVLTYTGTQAAGYAPGVGPGYPVLAPPSAAPTPSLACDTGYIVINYCSFDGTNPWMGCYTTTAHGCNAGDWVVFYGQTYVMAGAVAGVWNATSFYLNWTVAGGAWTINGGGVVKTIHATSIQTRAGVATVTTAAPHNLAPGADFLILNPLGQGGNNQPVISAYLGAWTVTAVKSATVFTFSMSGIPADAVNAGIVRATGGALNGTYTYQYTYASDSAETLPSPASSGIAVNPVASLPQTSPTFAASATTGGGLFAGQTYRYCFTATTRTGETVPTTWIAVTLPTGFNAVHFQWYPEWCNDWRIRSINIYAVPYWVTPSAYSQFGYIGSVTVAWNGLTTYTDARTDNSAYFTGGGPPPTVNTAGGAVLLAITTGDPRVTSRQIYRQLSGGPAVYNRVVTVADDVSLAAVDPVAQAQAQTGVPPPTVAGTFGAPGQLTGIPASGTGSIVAILPKGQTISIWVQRDSTAAQNALKAQIGGDGIIESLIDNSAIPTQLAAQQAGDADLALFGYAEPQITFNGRDPKLEVGATINVSLPAPSNVSASYVIQAVTISEFGLVGKFPKRTVEGARTRLTLQDLLQRVILRGGH
jgi:hypothetical protein